LPLQVGITVTYTLTGCKIEQKFETLVARIEVASLFEEVQCLTAVGIEVAVVH
jgi:hypothetical protein